MVSILTNGSSLAALQALKSVNARLATVQNQVSTGLRISEAAHGAAYWSISTTMRSDNKAISIVTDALGLGAAKVDVMYAATHAVVDTLSEIKAKLVLANGDGADKHKIQSELAILVEHAHAIVGSAVFAGSNWLSTDAAEHLADVSAFTTQIVSSFSRDGGGKVSVGAIGIDLKATSMLNAGGGGILQKEGPSLGEIGGFRNTGINSVAHNGHEDHLFTGPATFGASDFIEFVMNVDGGLHSAGENYTIRIDKSLIDAALATTDGVIGTAAQMRRVLERAFTANGIPATTYSTWAGGVDSGWFEIGSLEALPAHPGSSIEILGVTSSFPGGFALGLEDPVHLLDHDNMYPMADVWFDEPFAVWDGAEFYFDVQVGPSALSSVTVDHATVNAALGVTDGHIGTAADMAAVIRFAAQGLGLDVTSSGGRMIFSADQSAYPIAGNAAARVYVGNVRDNIGYRVQFDLDEIDITGNAFTADQYMRGVERMLSRAVSGAAVLGSAKRRIDMQSDFLGRLADALGRGIGQLTDADMNRTSVRLAALQAQQNLALQSLQIANSSPQSILTLFQ